MENKLKKLKEQLQITDLEYDSFIIKMRIAALKYRASKLIEECLKIENRDWKLAEAIERLNKEIERWKY